MSDARVVVLPTFDYELFHGHGYDSDEAILFAPTERMLERAAARQIPFTLFADICSVWAHRENELHAFADRFEGQLRAALASKHDVQLHVHAHWTDARYTDGAWEYRKDCVTLADLGFDTGLPSRVLERGVRYLEGLLKPVVPAYRCVAFRAGGLALEPDAERLLAALSQIGIRVDSSFARGLRLSADTVHIDYRQYPGSANWFMSPDAGIRTGAESGIFEVPIASFHLGILERLEFLVRRAAHIGKQRGAGMSRASRQSAGASLRTALRANARYLTKSPVFLFSADTKGLTRKMLRTGFQEYVRRHENGNESTLYVSMINHPKLMGRDREDLLFDVLDDIRDLYGDALRFATFAEVEAEIARPTESIERTARAI